MVVELGGAVSKARSGSQGRRCRAGGEAHVSGRATGWAGRAVVVRDTDTLRGARVGPERAGCASAVGNGGFGMFFGILYLIRGG